MTWTNDEEGASTATITLSQEGVVKLTHTATFDGLVADLTLSDEQTELPIGEYDYMVTLDYEDGTTEKYPDVSGCKDCTLPTLTICVANDGVIS